jgi:hypothetical protein
MNVQSHFGGGGLQTPEFTCGVEFEIESVRGFGNLTDSDTFIIEEDPSLRNNGREFKTKPSNFTKTLDLFDMLHKNLKLGKDPFSERTSTHVHVNVASLTLEQLRELTLTYALLEPLFFKFVGDERQHNIYCVPLSYTFLPSVYRNDAAGMWNKWHKYTAFNLKPVKDIGTVEFRHLYGTNKREVFVTWLSSLKELFEFIRDTDGWKVVEALETSSPAELARKIVPSLCEGLSNEEMNHLMEDTQLDVKLSVGGLK